MSVQKKEYSFKVTGTEKVYKIVAEDFKKAEKELLNSNNDIKIKGDFLFEKDRRVVIFNVMELK